MYIGACIFYVHCVHKFWEWQLLCWFVEVEQEQSSLEVVINTAFLELVQSPVSLIENHM